jgi:hypothetical protein
MAAPTAFGTIQVTAAENDTPILGYPYLAHGGEGPGDAYSFVGSNFQLQDAATITSMSCQMYIGYDINSNDEDSTYRFAIYSDSNGQVGELIGQTELGTVSKPADDHLPLTLDEFQTLNFQSPISLQAGTYWLAVIVHGPNILVDNDMTDLSVQRARTSLNDITFPSTVRSIQYIDNSVCAIYASGQGVSSVLPPPTADASNPGMSSLSVNCQSEGSTGEVQVFGDLSVYGAAIPQATIDFSYRQIGETEWHSIGSTITLADGSYSVDWLPSTQGNYLINATYWGSTTTSFAFKAVPVLITSISGNQSQTVFSVDSNSTVADLAFDSVDAQLSFSVTGETGTTGYVDVCVSKTLVADASTIQAYIDGAPADFTVSSAGDSWILHFSYPHSSHNIEFDLNSSTTSSSTATPEPAPELPQEALLIVAAASAAVAVVAVVLVLVRKKR